MNIVAAKELAGVIEDDLVVVVVVMEERHLDRSRIALEGARGKRADHKAIRREGRVDRGRQMVAMAHHRPEVLDVDATGAQVAVPTRGVERIERERRGRYLA